MAIAINKVSYAHSVEPVLKEITLTVPQGQFLGIVGPNGSGKTSLARLINGSLQADSGVILVDGLDVQATESMAAIRRLVAYVSADAENQLTTATVRDEIAFALQAARLPAAKIRERCEYVLDAFALRQYQDKHPFYLSAGEQFRLLLAASLARQPRYLILDEATSMMDSFTRSGALATLRQLTRKHQITIILLTQRLEDLWQADRIVLLQDGRVQADGVAADIIALANKEATWCVSVPLYYQLYDQLPVAAQTRFASLFAGMLPGCRGKSD